MPNNENNNDFNLPNLNNHEVPPREEKSVEPKPLIEIPQEYYDKIAAEKAEKARLEAEQNKERETSQEAKNLFARLFFLIVINAAAIFGLIYSYLNYNDYLILAIPVYIIVMAVIQAIINKKESMQPLAIMIGGMGVAVITFLLSATDSAKVDLWSYYAVASAISAFVGLILSSMITRLIGDFKNIKALQSVGMIIFIIALVGIPYYFYTKYPEEFYRILFMKNAEVKAETEEEFIIKTLKNRYNLNFVCDPESVKSNIDENHRKINQRLCYEESILSSKKIEPENIHRFANVLESDRIIVTSITYKESENQYIIKDDYIDYLLLRSFKTKVENSLTNALNVNKVNLYLYPETGCEFVGQCPDTSDYYSSLEKESNPDYQYKTSTSLDLAKYLTETPENFVDEYKFKYVITVTSSSFSTPESYQVAIDQVLSQLDALGLKNTYGYDISLYNLPLDNPYPTKVFQKEGQTNASQTFTGA